MSLPCTFNQQEETYGSHGQVGVKTQTNSIPFSKFNSRKTSRAKTWRDNSRKPFNSLLKTERSTQACATGEANDSRGRTKKAGSDELEGTHEGKTFKIKHLK